MVACYVNDLPDTCSVSELQYNVQCTVYDGPKLVSGLVSLCELVLLSQLYVLECSIPQTRWVCCVRKVSPRPIQTCDCVLCVGTVNGVTGLTTR